MDLRAFLIENALQRLRPLAQTEWDPFLPQLRRAWRSRSALRRVDFVETSKEAGKAGLF